METKKWKIIYWKNYEKHFKTIYKIGKKNWNFDDTEIEKCKFHQPKSPFLIGNIDINKIVVSNKASFGKKYFKYFIGYKDAKKLRSSCILLPKMSVYRKDISFTIKDEKLFKKYNKIWKKATNIIKKEFVSKPVCN